MDKKIIAIAFLLFIVYAAVFLIFPQCLSILELGIFDRFSFLSQKISYSHEQKDHFSYLKKIIIISIDEETLQKLHQQWPLSRAIYAQLINKLAMQNPRLALFDIVFSGTSDDKEADELLKQAMRGKGNFLFPFSVNERGEKLGSDIATEVGLTLAGYVNRPSDEDATIRRTRPFTITLDNKIIDHAFEVYACSHYLGYDLRYITLTNNKKVSLGEEWKQKAPRSLRSGFRLSKDNTIWLRFQASDREFATVSLWEVLEDNYDTSIFKDKIVFVGTTARALHDAYNTPLGLMPGVGIVANSMLMFLKGDFIVEAPLWLHWCVMFLFCFLIVVISYRNSIIKGFLFLVAVATLISAVTFILFLHGYYFNPLKLIILGVLGYVVINFYRYTVALIENMRLMRMSTIDELTGLYMFRYYKIVFEHEFQKYLRYKIPLSLLMIDIDNFKKINDTYGHPKGNVVLNKIGSIVQNNVRKADFPARYGGEEIAILLPNSNLNGARICGEHLRELIAGAEYFMTKEGPLKVTVSIGVASTDMEGVASSEDLLKFADTALYTAKKTGKNKVVVYDKNTMVDSVKQ